MGSNKNKITKVHVIFGLKICGAALSAVRISVYAIRRTYRRRSAEPFEVFCRSFDYSNMQSLRNAILSHVRIGVPKNGCFIPEGLNGRHRTIQILRAFGSATSVNQSEIIDRVVGLVKKFDKIDAAKVTETADFQKDLSLDSLDRVELVMAFEEEFSIEIPDADADKLKCCADVAKYVISGSKEGISETS